MAGVAAGSGWIRRPIGAPSALWKGVGAGPSNQHGRRVRGLLDVFQQRFLAIVIIALRLVVLYAMVTFVLRRFAYTRPWGDSLRDSLASAIGTAGLAIANALPSIFTIFLIGLATRAVVLFAEPWFDAVERGALTVSWMHPETAATTRRLRKWFSAVCGRAGVSGTFQAATPTPSRA
jgi:hypothetical protein